jgi:hypothetical protein
MSHSSSSSAHSRGTIPFSWENKPGVSKLAHQECPTEGDFVLKLPLAPPPCPSEAAKTSVHDLQIPLPPCTFQPPSRSSSLKGLRKHDHEDPFLAAYKECTKSTSKGKSFRNHVRSAFRKNMLVIFSCKRSCSVRDDNQVGISQLPYERDADS